MKDLKINVSLNCEISLLITEAEITRYEGLKKSRGLAEVSAGLLKLARAIQTEPVDQWVPLHREFQKIKPKGRYEDDKADAFIHDGVYRALKVAYALQSQENSVRLLSLMDALRSDALLPLNYEVAQFQCSLSQS